MKKSIGNIKKLDFKDVGCRKLLSSCSTLDNLFFPQPWSEEDWISLSNDRYAVFYYENNVPDVIGFSLFELDKHSSFAHLYKILINPEYLRSGLGSRLLLASLRDLADKGYKDFYLEVSTKNIAALELYQKLGFKTLCVKKKFYSNGDDAYAMQYLIE